MSKRFSSAVAFIVLSLFSTICVAQMPAPAAPIIGAKSYLVIDGTTGHEIASLDPDVPLAPASLTKIMTTYVVYQALKDGHISLDEEVTVSEKAWRTEVHACLSRSEPVFASKT